MYVASYGPDRLMAWLGQFLFHRPVYDDHIFLHYVTVYVTTKLICLIKITIECSGN